MTALFKKIPISKYQFPNNFQLKISKFKINWQLETGNWKLQRGFTLIELLVSIAIIGILATLALANFNAARQRGRDAQRKADLRNVQTALRTYYNDNGSYPTSNTANQIVGCGPKTARTACPWGGAWATSEGQTYMGTLPRDPLDQATTTAYDYRYVRSDPDIYTLQACLENKSDEKGKTTTDTGWCPSGWMYEVKP